MVAKQVILGTGRDFAGYRDYQDRDDWLLIRTDPGDSCKRA